MSRPRLSAVACALLLLASVPAARADEAADIQRLIDGGRAVEALAQAERALAAKPGDPQLRFLSGVALTDTKRTDEAIAVFVALTQDYPELAEPYNNLAVLYAARGRYGEAREALEMAVRNRPAYATAYENLGDVQARLAAESYRRARELDPRRRRIDAKLAALRTVFAPLPTAAAASPSRAGASAPDPAAR